MFSRFDIKKCIIILKRIGLGVLFVCFALLVFFETTIRDRIELALIAQVKSVSHISITNAVSDYIESNPDLCSDIINIKYDSNGTVKSISENVFAVNTLKTDITKASQNSVNELMSSHGINVQVGNFTGLTALSDFGPYVHMDVDATTTIKCEIKTKFESAGVNQTMHHSIIEMSVDIYVGNPIRIESIKYSTSYELAQTVIVGELPSNYGTISRY